METYGIYVYIEDKRSHTKTFVYEHSTAFILILAVPYDEFQM